MLIVEGRTIDLFAILSQHQRSERISKRRLQPAIRVTSNANVDAEAEALCDALDGAGKAPAIEKCSRVVSTSRTMDW